MNTYSLTEWVNTEFLSRNPDHIYTAICDCKKCETKNFVKVRTAQLPALAIRTGLGDKITAKQFQDLMHLIVQKLG
jgi:hypothetical protein